MRNPRIPLEICFLDADDVGSGIFSCLSQCLPLNVVVIYVDRIDIFGQNAEAIGWWWLLYVVAP